MLTYKNNNPYIEGTSLYDLVKVCETPFYAYSQKKIVDQVNKTCLLYTSPSPRDVKRSRMPSSA